MPTNIQATAPQSARAPLPTMYDLPYDDLKDDDMPDEFHHHQAALLFETFQPATVPPDQVFSGADMNLYYDPKHALWHKRPDWFGVIGVPRLYRDRESRLSYVPWDEGGAPLIIVELLSPSTKDEDLGVQVRKRGAQPLKWEVYEQILRVPYYVVFSREAREATIHRHDGTRYVKVGGRCRLPEAGIGLGTWQGSYHGITRFWLRWYDDQGNWIPTGEEAATRERQRAEHERRRATHERQRAEHEHQRAEHERAEKEQQQQRAERLAEVLRQLGHDPDQL